MFCRSSHSIVIFAFAAILTMLHGCLKLYGCWDTLVKQGKLAGVLVERGDSMSRKPYFQGHVGLTSAEAARILAEEGPNELPTSKQRGNLRIALDVMREPMFLLRWLAEPFIWWWGICRKH